MNKLIIALIAVLFSGLALAQGQILSDGKPVTAGDGPTTYSGKESAQPNTD
jgi:hypothetical protein